MHRKKFIKDIFLAFLGGVWMKNASPIAQNRVMTVLGPIGAAAMGFTLSHEHILVDFIGADKVSRRRYDSNEVTEAALPLLRQAKAGGVQTLIDCTPAYLGRDVVLLKDLASAAGIHILTTTGLYGASHEKFVPAFVFTESAQQLADRWIGEWKHGIDGTTVRPGLIKTGTDNGPLTAVQRKLIQAAGLTHRVTGLAIAVHTGDGKAAFEQLHILKNEGVSPAARIWVHAQNEPDQEMHVRAGRMGSWVSFDGVSPDTMQTHLTYLQKMRTNHLLNRVLVSQDSGWYHVGEADGGSFRPYTCISKQFVPLLRQHGFTGAEIDLIFKTNPANAFAIRA